MSATLLLQSFTKLQAVRSQFLIYFRSDFRGRSPSLSWSYTAYQNYCGRCRIRTRDRYLSSLERYQINEIINHIFKCIRSILKKVAVKTTTWQQRCTKGGGQLKNIYLYRIQGSPPSSLLLGLLTYRKQEAVSKRHQSSCRQNWEILWGVCVYCTLLAVR